MIRKTVRLKDTLSKISEAYEFIAEPVGSTLGPGGQNVILKDHTGRPILTKDGVTVSSNLNSQDEEIDMLISIIKEAGDKTNREAGDGTTSATVLSHEVFKEGRKFITGGHRAVDIQRSILKGIKLLTQALSEKSYKLTNETESLDLLKKIANISMNGDKEAADLVAEAVHAVGVGGSVTVQGSSNGINSWNKTEGLKIPRGWASPGFKKDENSDKIILENPYILITSYNLESAAQVMELEGLLNQFITSRDPILIIPSGIGNGFVSNMIANVKAGQLNTCVILPPYYGNIRREFFKDLEAATGAQTIDKDLEHSLKNVKLEHLGRAEKIEITANETIIVNGKGDKTKLNERIKFLETKSQDSNFTDLDKIRERLINLKGSIATIQLVIFSEIEFEERKHRIEDASNACKAALAEGILPGGGVALYRTACEALNICEPGEKILLNACENLVKKLSINAGNSGELAIINIQSWGQEDINREKTINHITGLTVNAFEKGILDPTKVIKTSLSNGASIAATLLTTGSIVTDVIEKQQPLLESYV